MGRLLPSHQDLRCSTFSLSTLHINFFPMDTCSLLKNKIADDKCSLKFGAERVNWNNNILTERQGYNCWFAQSPSLHLKVISKQLWEAIYPFETLVLAVTVIKSS